MSIFSRRPDQEIFQSASSTLKCLNLSHPPLWSIGQRGSGDLEETQVARDGEEQGRGFPGH